MNNLMPQIEPLLMGAALMLTVLELAVAIFISGIDRWSRHFFILYFSILVIYACLCVVEMFSTPDLRALMEIAGFFETLLSSFLTPLMTVYVLHSCGKNWKESPLFYAVAALWTLSFIMLIISPFTTVFYHYSPANEIVRGPFYPLYLVAVLAMLILTLAGVIHWRNRLSGRYFYSFLIGLLPMTIAVAIHIFVSVFLVFGIGIAICSVSMFSIILSDQMEQYLRQQREIAHQRASIMILQMRPHFIYNTMMSIYYLCKQDPDLAQQVTLDFTTYLRKIFTAIASEKLIPFTDELEHTRAYLAVEQAQFEDTLFVEYDTPHVDFLLPPLTLQPIVENAVKHGMDPDSEPLHLSIRTRRTDLGSEIIVENDGSKYEPADDNGPHIALENIQQRLKMMCRGRIMVTSRKEGGTVVKVTIP